MEEKKHMPYVTSMERQGREEGREEGSEKEALNIARAMVLKSMETAEIAELTGLRSARVRELRREVERDVSGNGYPVARTLRKVRALQSKRKR
jgi:hypothetical protein